MKSLFEKVLLHQRLNLPYVVYRKPNSKTLIGVFQNNDHLYFSENFVEKGFVFAPFDGTPVIFPLDKTEVMYNSIYFEHEFESHISDEPENLFEKEAFVSLVKKGIFAIKRGEFSKVVLSRKEIVNLDSFDIQLTFERMLQLYPSAFCYCWYHPKVGMWTGATPEKLIQAEGDVFNTMSLAGTQIYEGTEVVFWKEKEKAEQEFVTEFILENLKSHAFNISASNPYTTRAGNLLHLRTDVEGVINDDSNLKKVIDILHPTPAVCGLPKFTAKDFILKFEGYDREFYTGFLGELNHNFGNEENATDIFVNLRCMKIIMNQVQLFIGCGITKDSNPESEWEETINKSKTMKRVL